jgi:DNA-binding FadR family transcriptional regulator
MEPTADKPAFPVMGKRVIGRSEKVSEAVARELVREFATSEFAPGTKLPPESTMLETFGVGRGSLREALRILEIHGVISIRPGPRGGPIVEAVDSGDFARMASLFFFLTSSTYADLIGARRVTDPVMARLAAERRDAADLKRLKEVIDLAHSRLEATDAAWMDASSAFHLLLGGMSGNRVLDVLSQALMEIWIARLQHVIYPQPARSHTLQVHQSIAEAVTAGDGDAADEIMATHMSEFIEYANQHYPELLAEPIEWMAPTHPRREGRTER